MLFLKRLLICALAVLFISPSFAQVQIQKAADFSAVQRIIQKVIDKNGAHHVLVAFDDDDTLLTMPQDLGSVSWEKWQEKLYREYKKTGKSNPALVAHTLSGIYKTEMILFTLSKMRPTGKNIPSILKGFAKEGVSLMIATARSPDDINTTEAQLKGAKFTDQNGKIIFSDTAPKTQSGKTSYAGVFYPTVGLTKRPLFYLNGIFYLSGQNKGNMLLNFIKKFDIKGKTTLVFIDDQQNNVDDVYHAMKNNNLIRNTVSIYYLKEHARQQNFLKDTAGQQEKTQKAWNDLSSAIKRNLVESQLPK